jgi:hypothetical protein
MKAPKSNPSQTVLVICTGFTFVYFVFRQDWILYGTFSVGLLAILFKDFAKKIEWVWFKISYILSLIVPNIVLGIIFYLFLTPIAFIASLFNKEDSFLIKKPVDSAFKTVNKQFEAKDLKNPW